MNPERRLAEIVSALRDAGIRSLVMGGQMEDAADKERIRAAQDLQKPN
jgi:hypothetical protein